MLRVTIPGRELWDDENEEFIYEKEQTLQLEHSLVSVSKWESEWCKPFLSREPKTDEETIYYIKCMTLTQNVDPAVYDRIPDSVIEQIKEYIEKPMTATTFTDDPNAKVNREIVTNEIIYHWMTALNIPIDREKWHLNRLMTLIRVCNIKNQPPKRMSNKDVIARQKAINKANRKRFNTRG